MLSASGMLVAVFFPKRVTIITVGGGVQGGNPTSTKKNILKANQFIRGVFEWYLAYPTTTLHSVLTIIIKKYAFCVMFFEKVLTLLSVLKATFQKACVFSFKKPCKDVNSELKRYAKQHNGMGGGGPRPTITIVTVLG